MTDNTQPEPEVLAKVRELETLLAQITNAHATFITLLARKNLGVLFLCDSHAVDLLAKRAARAQELLTELRTVTPYLVLTPDEPVPDALVAILSQHLNVTVPDDISGLEDSL